MGYEMKGTVTEIFPMQTLGSKGFQKREFRIKEKSDNKWPNFVAFQLVKEKCNLADSISEGDEVNVHFNISGRIWDKGDGSPTRCFIENQCWKLDILKKAQSVPSVAEPPPDAGAEEMIDDMPF